MANGVFNKGLYTIATANVAAATLKLMLVKNDYTFSANNDFVANVAANAVSVSGYADQTLSSVAIVEDDTNGFAFLYAANVTFSALATGQTVGGAILFVDSGSNTTSALVAYYDITDTPTNGGDISINWAANSSGGVLKLSQGA